VSNDIPDPILENVSPIKEGKITKTSSESLQKGPNESLNKENLKSLADIAEASINGSDNTDLDEWLTNAFHKHLEKVI